ncbi:NUDIX domain-containing protein [Aeromicrobium sp. 636]|uniref:CoA pyrophosphatase n=1 Tax=Aeromicrobium senzhongii TaxID=2663859 RepID=A0A8I0K145_9ACTN|nr:MULTISPECIES: CoA pyrophosphatase [Aeromicrobium]MBC9227046.1 CoA pyrophosphatase [Aeromicrobium senzhongii]MCQ3999146.1 NUDIX domain-containing protein [Aeromicrobium sp. 636]MTB89353.1 NUDIX domain-containing protein [Aeromicrobium senzhongii]QNL94495.1 CoA pyrophosphatase [Aeromicrobium senzhongii]
MTQTPPTSLPDWLRPLADLLGSVEAEQLAPRFPHPPADARPAAVLMLFSEGERGRELLLTERAATLRNHAGQISFPGGKQDDTDRDPVHTALREAEEEVGLDPSEVVVFGTLPTLWLPPSNHAVTPVLGYWTNPHPLTAHSPDEVEQVLPTSLDLLLDPERRFSVVHPSGWTGPAFDIGAETPLWGFTAGIISRLFERLGWERPWDATRTRPLPE